jgi:arylsulfate sulfotransferase
MVEKYLNTKLAGQMRRALLGSVLAAFAGNAWAISVKLDSAFASPAPVGTMIHFTATASDATAAVTYRFRVREVGQGFHLVKDFGIDNTLDWTAANHEGFYEIEATARTASTGETADATQSFEMQSRITGDQPVINPTAHPLVFLYSAPPCPVGQIMRVQFRGADGSVQVAPGKACQAGVSMNFYIAGLKPMQEYKVRHGIVTDSGVQTGPVLSFTTPDIDVTLPARTVLQTHPTGATEGVLVQAALANKQMATDLNGDVVWYYPGTLSYLTRPEPGGRFLGLVVNTSGDQAHQLLREIDLAGMTLRETNAARVNEYLAALGKRQISGFHHEARLLPNGNILVLGGVEQMTDGVQGPDNVDIDVIGDMIIVLDPNLQVVWAWDAFDHLDITRPAVLGEMCPGGCTPLYLAPTANDWTHGNSVQLAPDGNLIYSTRHQEWVIKIDYQNGAGTGDIIWKLGNDGDFSINSTDSYPWFSHQHDAHILDDGTTMMMLDNGNVRHLNDGTANSRGQVFQLDETNHTATPLLNADLGVYSFALGSAQKLSNGNYHFLAGLLTDGSSISIEVDPQGQIVYEIKVQANEYRSFRMRSLYVQ